MTIRYPLFWVAMLLVFSILLFACAKPWVQQGATQQQFYADNSSCLAMSGAGSSGTQVVAGNDPATTGYNQGAAAMAAANRQAIYEQCMLGKGWHHGQY